MKGRNDHSFSAVGSVPSATPNQFSISGPLTKVSLGCDSLHGQVLPRVVKSYDADNGRKAGGWRHCIALRIYTLPGGRLIARLVSRLSAAETNGIRLVVDLGTRVPRLSLSMKDLKLRVYFLAQFDRYLSYKMLS